MVRKNPAAHSAAAQVRSSITACCSRAPAITAPVSPPTCYSPSTSNRRMRVDSRLPAAASRIYAEFMSFRSEPIKRHIGEIVHVDRAGLADDSVVSQCLELIETRCVLVFPRFGLSDEEQLA